MKNEIGSFSTIHELVSALIDIFHFTNYKINHSYLELASIIISIIIVYIINKHMNKKK